MWGGCKAGSPDCALYPGWNHGDSAAQRTAGRRTECRGGRLRSDIVGKPAAMMLLNASATVTVCHSKTADLPKFTQAADFWWPPWDDRDL